MIYVVKIFLLLTMVDEEPKTGGNYYYVVWCPCNYAASIA